MSVQTLPRAQGLPAIRFNRGLAAKVAVGVLAIALLALFISVEMGVFWLLGMAFGFILQRSRLCFASAFRDLFLMREGRNMKAILAGIAVATAGFALLMQKAVPDPAAGAFPDQAHVVPTGLYLAVGGLLFGIGMVVAGGCVSGSMYRVGEGYVASAVALLGVLAGLEAAAHSWNWWFRFNISTSPIVWLPNSLGYGGALLLTGALLLAAYIGLTWWESGRALMIAFKQKAEDAPATFRANIAHSYRRIFVKGWPMLAGAVALGVLNILAFTYEHPLGVTGELATWADRGAKLMNLGAPKLLGVDRLAGCNLAMDASAPWLNHNFALDGGLIFGAFFSAVLASEFKIRLAPHPRRYVQSLGGGVLMGYGAGLAVGCTIGAFFSAIPSLGLNGWVFGLSLLAGSFAGVKLIQRIA
ncbi:MAG TPA: YeeE/YedE family protein [Chloroflexota bacterium]